MTVATYELKLSGGKALLAGLAVLLLLLFRVVTLNQHIDDDELLRSIEIQLQSEHYPGHVEALKSALATEGVEAINTLVENLKSSGITIDSVKGSYPVFKFTSPKDVVVKVRYTAVDDSGQVSAFVKYYLYTEGALGLRWQYHRETTVISYYLNFL